MDANRARKLLKAERWRLLEARSAHEKDLSLLAQVNADVQEVEAALRRLDYGTYGRCEMCGAVIPDDRLEAVPAARLCVKHEWSWELEGATFLPRSGDSSGEPRLAEEVAGREARRNLEFVPTEDELAEVVELGPEESALHLNRRRPGVKARPDATELEQAEASEAGELADESIAARRAEAEDRRAAEELASEERALGDTA